MTEWHESLCTFQKYQLIFFFFLNILGLKCSLCYIYSLWKERTMPSKPRVFGAVGTEAIQVFFF